MRASLLLCALFWTVYPAHSSFGGEIPPAACLANVSLSIHQRDTKHLDCSRQGLSTLAGLLFPQKEEVSSLDLSQNELLFPELSPLPSALLSLNLSHNVLLQGLKGSSHPFPTLLSLDLSSNNISSLKDLQFNLFPRLQVLSLAQNKILYLTPHVFTYLSSLLSLNLRSNALVQIQEGSLHGLQKLEELFLSRNALVALPKGLFLKSVPGLKFLDLSKNRFAKIEGLSFHGLTELLVLKIKKNAVEYLSDGAFFGLEKIRHLYLDRNKISSVEKGWLYGLRTLETLSLSHNRIDYVAEDAWEFLGVLRELNLKSNHLQLLERDALRSLPSLTHLLLQDNRISHIDDASRVFEEVPRIEVLHLDGNALSHTIEDSDSPFAGLKRLRKLTMSRNKIKSIGELAFQGNLHSLEEIDLRSNIISTIHEKSIRHLNSLKSLKIDSKSFLCDCYLRWLPDFINNTRLGGLNQALCAHPQSLKGTRVVSVPIESFTCEDFPKPYILQQPETQITLRGHNLSLFCRAASTSAAEMTFLWKFDSEVIHAEDCLPKDYMPFCVHNQAHSFDGKGREITSELRLMNLTYDDAGRYQCIVSNAYGATYSDRANITVYVFPTFLITPEDVVVQGSQSATLNCAAKGVPAPKVSWKKDHGNDFPAARERRITQIMDPSSSAENNEVGSRISVNSFIIHNVTAVDMGIYTCTARNSAGEISWNITLSVLEVPGFVKKMQDKVAKEGETAVIDCSAKGSPRPTFVWTKDGKEFHPTERHFFAANNQLLIIVKVEPSDEGRYECTIQNQLGSASQSSYLKLDHGENDIPGDPFIDKTTMNIIIVAIVCCVIGTSLIWIFVIYRVRKNRCTNRNSRRNGAPSPVFRECYELDDERRVVPVRKREERSKRHLVYPSDPRGHLLSSSSSFYASHHSLRTASSIGASLNDPSPAAGPKSNPSGKPKEEFPGFELSRLPLLRPILENNFPEEPSQVSGGGESVMNLSDVELADIPFADDSSNEDDIYLESSTSPSKHNDTTFTIHSGLSSPSPLKLSELEEEEENEESSPPKAGALTPTRPPSTPFKLSNVYLSLPSYSNTPCSSEPPRV